MPVSQAPPGEAGPGWLHPCHPHTSSFSPGSGLCPFVKLSPTVLCSLLRLSSPLLSAFLGLFNLMLAVDLEGLEGKRYTFTDSWCLQSWISVSRTRQIGM